LRGALQGAAAQALGESSATLRGRLLRSGEKRDQTLIALRTQWNLEATPAALGALLWPLQDRESQFLEEMEAQALGSLLDDYLTGIEASFPEDAKGQRRNQVRRVHHDRVVVMRRDLDFPLVDLLAQQHEDYPGLFLMEVARRIYPDDVSPLLVGATRQVNPDETDEYEAIQDRFVALRRLFHRTPEQEAEFRQIRDRLWSDTLRPDETRGATGVELVYEEQLRGSRGYLQVLEAGEEDGLPLELLFSPPRNGTDIVLSLDSAMEKAAQRVVEKVYRDTPGRLSDQFPETPDAAFHAFDAGHPRVGFALLDLRTGETPLVMSTPTFTREEYRRDYARLRDIRAGSPLRNRALGGGYYAAETPFPGSTFKPLVAAAALQGDPTLWNRIYHCAGFIEPIPGGRALKCDSRWGHGDVAMREALKKSCNVYFYLLAEEIGAAAIHHYARGLGFDRPTGMELVQFDPTASAVHPFLDLEGDARLERNANYLDDLASLDRSTVRLMSTAIGQVGVQASPLQMARFYGWLATGELLQPRLVQSGGGGSPARVGAEVPTVAPGQRARILDALSAVSYEEGGTAERTSFPADWGIVGKTGTAQVAAAAGDGGLAPTHAWFTGFFPADEPRYAFAVLCENTGLHGGQVASFILKEFLQTPEAASLLGSQQ
ncbi:MAG: penicillin-binding transpeptidase domain-containing protein, partial [Planctomycetota bacterium]